MEKKVRYVKILARCGMLQNPHQQLPESNAAACCCRWCLAMSFKAPNHSWYFKTPGASFGQGIHFSTQGDTILPFLAFLDTLDNSFNI